MAVTRGPADYRDGALCRLDDATRLRDQQRWVGATYLAGRAVEAMFLSLVRAKTKEQTSGHNLRDLLKRARSLGMLGEVDPKIDDNLSEVAIVWHNDLRFVGDDGFLRLLKRLKKDRRIKGDPVKTNAKRIVEACEAIVARGELVWNRYKKNSKR